MWFFQLMYVRIVASFKIFRPISISFARAEAVGVQYGGSKLCISAVVVQ